MKLARRSLIFLAAAFMGGWRTPLLAGDAAFVEPYDPDRDRTLFHREKPFIAAYRRAGRTLGFVAALHETGPSSATFQLVRKAFDLIQPAILVVEGFPTTWGENPERIVRQVQHRNAPNAGSYARSEAGYAASTALDRRVPFLGGEPTDAELAHALIQMGYDRQDIFYAFLFAPFIQETRAGVVTGPLDPRFEAVYEAWARSMRDALPDAPGGDLPSFKAWFQKHYGLPFTEDPSWMSRGSPGAPGVAGQIVGAQSLARDQHLFDLMIRLLNEHHRVLVVYGASHLSSLHPALERSIGFPKLIGSE